MSTTKLTTAAAIVRYLIAQRTVIDDVEVPLFPGVFAIFGHGNVTSLGLALQEAGDALPTWRGQNEQGMGWPLSGTPRLCSGARSWWPRRRSGPARSTW